MKKTDTYRNITTGAFVIILDVRNSTGFGTKIVEYRRLKDDKEFFKPEYVFLQTYKQVINMK